LRLRATLAALLALCACGVRAQDSPAAAALPSLAELEAAGAIIGEIRIAADDVFNLDDPAENNWLFRFANHVHVQTRPDVIRNQLLFRSGEKLVAQRVLETERLLRGNRYLYEARIRPVAWRDGVVDLEVRTRDSWTLQFGASVESAGGTTTSGARISEYNLLGTGARLTLSTRSTTQVTTAGGTPSGVDFGMSYPYAFDGRTTVGYAQASFDDGDSRSFNVTRPFYALDARGAGNFSAATDSRLLAQYADGAEAGRFRRRSDSADLSGGWSPGLVNGWAHRFSLGLSYLREQYDNDPLAPATLPGDRLRAGPYFQYAVVEDDFREVTNVQTIGRPEYQALGLQASVQLGRSAPALGATDMVTWYAASVSRGFRFHADRTLLAFASISGEYAQGDSDRVVLGGALRYYQRRGSGSLLYVALSADATEFSDATQYLSLGGDAGLRGYPSNYQLGSRRVLLTAEQRMYSDLYILRLIRIGGAIFYDVGRAWGEPYQNFPDPRWSANAGFGLRLLSARSATGTTLHLDIAFPLRREPGLDSYQLTMESKSSF
jgi:outer membrane protein assembly factor BamA